MGVRDICLRDTLRKILLNLQRGIGSVRDKSQTMGYTVDMRVDGKGGLSIPHTLQDIGRFPPHPGNVVSSSVVEGTSPPKSETSFRDISTKCLDLELG